MKTSQYKTFNVVFLLVFSVSLLFFTVFSTQQTYSEEFTAPPVELTREGRFENLQLTTNLFGIQGEGEERVIKLTEGSDVFGKVVNMFLRIIISIAGVIAVIMIAVQGTKMIYSKLHGSVDKLINSKERLVEITVGLILLLLSYLLLNFINQDLLDGNILKSLENVQQKSLEVNTPNTPMSCEMICEINNINTLFNSCESKCENPITRENGIMQICTGGLFTTVRCVDVS